MKTFARIVDNTIVECQNFPDSIVISETFHPSLLWVDITGMTPAPAFGWVTADDGKTFTAPKSASLADLQTKACLKLKNSYRSALYGTFTDAQGNTWQVDRDSRHLLCETISAVVSAGGSLPSGFGWVNSDNKKATMTIEEFKALFSSIQSWTQNMHTQYEAQKTAISELTLDNVESYVVPAWPKA